VHYLQATKDKGLILKPSSSLTLDMFIDANFAGMWHKEYSHLRDSMLSRTGYLILFGNCPITWSSKLQTRIALLTTKSESTTRDLIPRQYQEYNISSFKNI
jgi:hypothetical protein